MEDDNLLSVEQRLIDFSLDESINDLKRYYSTPTTWEIIKQSRIEPCHTKFLAWFFGNKDFNADPNFGPIKKLIVLLLKLHKEQGGSEFNNVLKESIYSGSLDIKSYNVEAEHHINDSEYGDGNIDIYISCEVTVNNKEPKKLNIVIENKIYSPETKKGELYQTQAYYNCITKKYNDGINLFVFLKPSNCKLSELKPEDIPGCNCENYIRIDYQELVDNIIQPVCNREDISEENVFRLKDYIKTLGKPSDVEDNKNNKTIIKSIIAIGDKEKKLLQQFFENNEALIRAAIYAMGNDQLSKAMSEFSGDKDRSQFKIEYHGKSVTAKKNNLALQFIIACNEIGILNKDLYNKLNKIRPNKYLFESNKTKKNDEVCITMDGKRYTKYVPNNIWGQGVNQYNTLVDIIKETCKNHQGVISVTYENGNPLN